MKSKRGFTLIELLAVIVILAIIALIATPIILNMIEDARKSAAVDSAYGYVEAIEYNNSMDQLSDNYEPITSGNVVDINKDVNVKGTKPTSGTVTIENGRVTEAILVINGYTVKYENGKATVDGKKTETKDEVVAGPTSENPDTTKTKGLIKIVYLDPTNLQTTCTKEDAENNLNENGTPTGVKTGCMKWYAYKDDGTNYTMILDHNTTPLVAYNSKRTNTEMLEVKIELDKLVSESEWKVTTSLITADEIAQITGAKESLKWDSSKTFGEDDIETNAGRFYFDGKGTTYSSTDGWKKRVATSQGASKYAWLYDNTNGCTSYGCNISDDNKYDAKIIYGYWTSSPVGGFDNYVWNVICEGKLSLSVPDDVSSRGLRPVITVDKSIIS